MPSYNEDIGQVNGNQIEAENLFFQGNKTKQILIKKIANLSYIKKLWTVNKATTDIF